MSLMSEIQVLRAQIDAHSRKAPATGASAEQQPASRHPSPDSSHDGLDIDAFLKAVNETLDEFADELDRFPRLTALAALGVGLAAGVVIGRQLR